MTRENRGQIHGPRARGNGTGSALCHLSSATDDHQSLEVFTEEPLVIRGDGHSLRQRVRPDEEIRQDALPHTASPAIFRKQLARQSGGFSVQRVELHAQPAFPR